MKITERKGNYQECHLNIYDKIFLVGAILSLGGILGMTQYQGFGFVSVFGISIMTWVFMKISQLSHDKVRE